jgi:hypothetical protein
MTHRITFLKEAQRPGVIPALLTFSKRTPYTASRNPASSDQPKKISVVFLGRIGYTAIGKIQANVKGAPAMMRMRLCVLLIILLSGLGCASEGSQAQWDEFWKDVRGDNMRMRSGNFSEMDSMEDRPIHANQVH